MKTLLVLLLLTTCSLGETFNDVLLRAIKSMPTHGGYSVKKTAFDGIAKAVLVRGDRFNIQPAKATPSFCSSATYIAFLMAVAELEAKGKLKLSAEEVKALQFQDEKDGVGFWGKWNSNGPGVAKLVSDLRLGENFQSYDKARAGDFMKIFWTDEIGKKEHGHLVIYIGQKVDQSGKETVLFWSSNQPNGYGYKEVPKEKISWAIFSRIKNIKKVSEVRNLPQTDQFLVNMLSQQFSQKEVIRVCKIKN